jgi:hypothetical protein
MAVQFSDDPESWAATLNCIAELKEAVWAGEAPTAEGIHTVLLLHALSLFPSFVDSLLAVPDLDPTYISTRLVAKQQMLKTPGPSAYAATGASFTKKKERDHCNNPSCKSLTGHSYPYCISPGGGNGRKDGGGRSREEARGRRTYGWWGEEEG